VEEIARVGAEIAVLSDEIDSETDTEHEPPEVSPAEEQVEEVEGIHPEIAERIRELREVFITEEQEEKREIRNWKGLRISFGGFKKAKSQLINAPKCHSKIRSYSSLHNPEASGSVETHSSAQNKTAGRET
jgi:hypothetical protein